MNGEYVTQLYLRQNELLKRKLRDMLNLYNVQKYITFLITRPFQMILKYSELGILRKRNLVEEGEEGL